MTADGVNNPYDDTVLLALIADLDADIVLLQADIDALEIDVDAIRAITDAEAVLEETGGTITADGTEQDVYINLDTEGVFRPICVKVDFSNHEATETIVLRTYYQINPTGGLVLQDAVTYVGVPTALLINIDLEPNRYGIWVSLEKTAGTNRNYDWEAFYEVSP